MINKETGVSIWGLVWLLLIVLKLVGAIQMGWFAVITSVIWMPLLMVAVVLGGLAAIVGVVLIILGIAALVVAICDR